MATKDKKEENSEEELKKGRLERREMGKEWTDKIVGKREKTEIATKTRKRRKMKRILQQMV